MNADANYVEVWQLNKLTALIYATRYNTRAMGWFIFLLGFLQRKNKRPLTAARTTMQAS
jgi:hypothetical protein